jgi:hypothetical protein
LTIYRQHRVMMGGSGTKQSLIVMLTKGDRLPLREACPGVVSDLLSCDPLQPASFAADRLESQSQELRRWLGPIGYHNCLVLPAAHFFTQVRYCVVSALGTEVCTDSGNPMFDPRGALAPLFWLVRHPWSSA